MRLGFLLLRVLLERYWTLINHKNCDCSPQSQPLWYHNSNVSDWSLQVRLTRIVYSKKTQIMSEWVRVSVSVWEFPWVCEWHDTYWAVHGSYKGNNNYWLICDSPMLIQIEGKERSEKKIHHNHDPFNKYWSLAIETHLKIVCLCLETRLWILILSCLILITVTPNCLMAL